MDRRRWQRTPCAHRTSPIPLHTCGSRCTLAFAVLPLPSNRSQFWNPHERVPRPPVVFVRSRNSTDWSKRSTQQASASTRTPGHPFPEGGAPTSLGLADFGGSYLPSILIDQGFPIKGDAGDFPEPLLFLQGSRGDLGGIAWILTKAVEIQGNVLDASQADPRVFRHGLADTAQTAAGDESVQRTSCPARVYGSR